ncbi:MAG: ankyrin repeat domain-containing protein [Candidatus Cloacimonetes bacterium]|nr:ankyrin repeat domain-containing protein [Candidatus Cloacimonadota bacterium]
MTFFICADGDVVDKKLMTDVIERDDHEKFKEIITEKIQIEENEDVGKDILRYIAAREVDENKYFTITNMINLLRSHLFKDEFKYSLQPQNRYIVDAINNNSLKDVKKLLCSGTDVNTLDKNGWNYLHHTVIQNRYEISKYLISQGILINWVNNNGCTPLDYAKLIKRAFNDSDIYDLLLEHKAIGNSEFNCEESDLLNTSS